MSTKILLRRDTESNFTSANPTLGNGEMAYITDTGRAKIGNGTDAWADLAYFTPALDDTFHILNAITSSEDTDEVVVWDNSTSSYKKMTRLDFLKNDSVKVIDTISTAKAITNLENNALIYISSVNVIYKYVTAGAGYVADDKYVLITGNGADTRFIAVGGAYSSQDVDLLTGHVFRINNVQVLTSRQSAITNVAELSSPVGGGGSGATATTFSGTECDLLRAEVLDLKTQLNLVLGMLRTHGLISS